MRIRALVFMGLVSCATVQRGVISGDLSTPSSPLAETHVVITREGLEVARTTTDQHGHFEVAGLGAGEFVIRADASKLGALAPGTTDVVAVRLPPEGAKRTAALRLIPASLGAPISGVLLDQFDRPIEGQVVCADTTLRELDPCAVSDANGEFRIAWISGATRLTGRHGEDERYGPGPTVTATAGQRGVVMRLRYRPQLSGRVVDESGSIVGRFNLNEDAYRMGVFATRSWDSTRPLEVSAVGFATEFVAIPPGDRFGDVVLPQIVLTRGAAIRGTVADAEKGTALADAQVARPGSLKRLEGPNTFCGTAFEAWKDAQLPEVTTDSDGRFEILLARGQQEIVVSKPGFRDAVVRVDGAAPLFVKLDRGATIEGRVLGLDGKPLADMELEVKPGKHTARTDENGAFKFTGLEGGPVLLRSALDERVVRERVQLTVGKTTKVDVRQRATSRLLVHGVHGTELTICRGVCALPETTESLAPFRAVNEPADLFTREVFSGLPAGQHTLIGWKRVGTTLVLERQVVVLPAQEVGWAPTSKRSYAGAAALARDDPSLAEAD